MRRTWTGAALVILGISGTAGSASAQGSVESDREALVALYDATDGDNWRCNGGWTTDAPLDQWDGVTTNASGRVTEVVLVACGLSGTLPPDLGDLASLEKLTLMNNRNLSGPIPPELGRLTNLDSMTVADNNLSGPIPPELGDLTSLRGLRLEENNLSGPIPPELGNLTNLEYELGLGQNNLSGPIPPELGNLVKLGGTLNLQLNNLSGPVPPELGDLNSLGVLVLAGNDLSGPIPPELGDMTALRSLYLSRNSLTGPIPREFGSMTNLSYLDLSSNDLSGPIPLELANSPELAILALSPGNDDLCAPGDVEFVAWLRSLQILVWAGPWCSGGDVAPTPQPGYIVQALVDLAVEVHGGLKAGGTPLTMDISVLFTYGLGSGASARDAAGPPGVTFSAASDDQAVATLTMSGSDLTIAPAGMGEAGITVTATDGTTSAQAPFSVTVEPTPVPALPLAGVLVLGALSCWLGRRRLAGRR